MPSDDPESPYTPPDEDGVAVAYRPTALLVVSVMAIVLGLMGIFGALSTCASAVGSSTLSSIGHQSMTPEQWQAQQALLAAQRPLLPLFLGLAVATLPLALLLIGGGSLTLANRLRGVQLLGWAFVYGLILEPLRVLAAIIQYAVTWEETTALMHLSTQVPPGSPPMSGFEEIMYGIMIGSVILGMVVAALWMVAKMAFYFVGLRILGGEGTRAWRREVEQPA